MELWQFAKRWRCEFAEDIHMDKARCTHQKSPENRRILLNIARAWRERADHAEKKIKDSPSDRGCAVQPDLS
jgi:hypothetical protein